MRSKIQRSVQNAAHYYADVQIEGKTGDKARARIHTQNDRNNNGITKTPQAKDMETTTTELPKKTKQKIAMQKASVCARTLAREMKTATKTKKKHATAENRKRNNQQ